MDGRLFSVRAVQGVCAAAVLNSDLSPVPLFPALTAPHPSLSPLHSLAFVAQTNVRKTQGENFGFLLQPPGWTLQVQTFFFGKSRIQFSLLSAPLRARRSLDHFQLTLSNGLIFSFHNLPTARGSWATWTLCVPYLHQ